MNRRRAILAVPCLIAAFASPAQAPARTFRVGYLGFTATSTPEDDRVWGAFVHRLAHHPFHPGFKGELPYVLATVDLEEGVRMLAQLRGVAPDAIAVGLPVEVAFERATEELTLPVFVRQDDPAGRMAG